MPKSLFIFENNLKLCYFMSVNSRIRQIREEKNLLRREVANKLGISDVAYGKLENEKTKVKVDTLKKIAEILDEPLEKFFQESKECNIIQHNQNTEQINQNIQTIINETDAKKIEELYINLVQSKDSEIAMLKILLVSKDEKVAVLEREIFSIKNLTSLKLLYQTCQVFCTK